jgi:hypothetical protein
VHAHPLRWDVASGVVDGFDVLGREATVVVERPALGFEDGPSGRQVGAVELEDQTGLVDGVVLLLHGVTQGHDVLLVGPVVLVRHEQGDHAGRPPP